MPPGSGQAISVVVAMYNEEESLPQLFEKLGTLQSVKPRDWLLDFVLVNDGSSDRTLEVAGRLKPPEWDVQVLSHAVNQGFGAAIRTGFAAARGKVVVCYDADCTYPVEDVIKLVREVLAGADVATANAFSGQGKIIHVPLWRRFLSNANSWLYRLVVGPGGKDIQVYSCAFRAYRGELVRELSFQSNGFGAASEILGRLILSGHRIVQVDSVLTTREFGQSKMHVLKATLEHFKVLWVLAKRHVETRREKTVAAGCR
jgi:dolichol-phosphate mannosyltransferase